MKNQSLWAVLTGSLLFAPLAQANVHDTFGASGRSIAMGNAQVANVTGGAAAYYNVAALGRVDSIQLEIGIQNFMPRFADFEGIVFDANQNGMIDYDAEGNPETTSVGTKYAPTSGTSINAAIPVFKFLTFGASIYMPSQYLMRLQFEDPYIPYYAMYKNRTQRFSMYVGLGIKVFDGLYLGAGASSSAATNIDGRFTANIEVDANPTDENGETLPTQVNVNANVDSMSVSMKGSTATNFGILLNFGWLAKPLEGLNLGATYRSETYVQAEAHIEAMAYGSVSLSNESVYSGPLMTAPVSNSSLTQSSYNPAQFAAGLSYEIKDKLSIGLDVTSTKWSTYHETFISSTQTNSSGGAEVNVQVGRDLSGDPGTLWKDTVTPRIGLEYKGGMPKGKELGFGFSVRAGYGYAPSPVPNQSGNANMLDSDKHLLSAGLGFNIPLSRLENPLKIDLFAAYHKLKTRVHTKDPSVAPDETGAYPAGYPVGGAITSEGGVAGFGLTAGLTF